MDLDDLIVERSVLDLILKARVLPDTDINV
jgi:hypothetical protein